MKTKEVDVGNITGLSSYQLAVLTGQFTGSLEEYIQKEMETYNQTVAYADKVKAEMESLLASIADNESSIDLAELIHARGSYKLLGERLNANDQTLSIILDKLNQLDPDSLNIDTIKLFGSGQNVELRNNGIAFQWRQVGETDWIDLIQLAEITPNIQIGEVEASSNPEDVKVSVSGTRLNPLLNFILPKGKDGVDGGSILNARLNEEGELILTVKNGDDDVVVSDGTNEYLVPIITVGNVETLEYDQEAYVTMTGSLTNPVLNFGIPRGKPTKISKAYIGDDGFLVFETE